jgi:hypothetical protein
MYVPCGIVNYETLASSPQNAVSYLLDINFIINIVNSKKCLVCEGRHAYVKEVQLVVGDHGPEPRLRLHYSH